MLNKSNYEETPRKQKMNCARHRGEESESMQQQDKQDMNSILNDKECNTRKIKSARDAYSLSQGWQNSTSVDLDNFGPGVTRELNNITSE